MATIKHVEPPTATSRLTYQNCIVATEVKIDKAPLPLHNYHEHSEE
jgi:hypothetical protein